MAEEPKAEKRVNTVVCDLVVVCGFTIRSHDAEEVVRIATAHSLEAHGHKVSAATVRGLIKKE